MSHNGTAKANGKDPSSRQSLPPLAPLQFLQNQRRGSITDPSLHAHKHNGSYRDPGGSGSSDQAQLGEPRPASPYVFGDATPHSGESLQIRNLLRTPSLEKLTARRVGTSMDVDSFDYSMRRHSIAVGHGKGGQGTKRKVSGDAGDGQLAGPGVPSGQDDGGRASKRRGSAIDTARIAQLSLNDRRNSVDARVPATRDHTSSLLPYPSAFSGPDSQRPPAVPAFAWPANPAQDQPMLDPTAPHPIIPSISFPDGALRSSTEQPTPQPDEPLNSPRHKDPANTPYSRSPELRVSHKLAERKRRKEMKDLFDELRDQLPADRGMKASKWEILSKAIDFVAQLKQSHQDMAREMEMLRHELDVTRQGIPFGPGGPVVYGQPPGPGQFPPAPPGALQHPHVPHPQHPHVPPPPQHAPPPPNPPLSRPPSSQNVASPDAPAPPLQNGNGKEPPPPT